MDLMQRRRVMLAGKKPRLPKEYQEVEWIQGTGTQYIETGIPIQSPITIESDVLYTDGGDYALCCASYTDGGSGPAIVRIGANGYYDGSIQNYYAGYYFAGTLHLNERYLLRFYGEEGKQETWEDGVLIKQTTRAHSNIYLPIDGTRSNFLIFGEERDKTRKMFLCKACLYSHKMSNPFGPLGNFIPCRRKFDSKPGMYDTVTKQFFTNAGTGEFLVGPDVN